jgi:hypothetical protein
MYCQFIILTFVVCLLCAMRLWTMGVMHDNNILLSLPHPVSLAKVRTQKQRKG